MKSDEFSLSNAALTELLETVVSRNASFRFCAKGFSMIPFIRDGDTVTISPIPKSFMSFGKMVAFIKPVTKNLAIHRIVGKKNGYYLIKGDNVPCADGLVPRDNILGYVTKIERNGRRFYIGLGPENLIIAILSRGRILDAVSSFWPFLPSGARKFLRNHL